MPDLLYGYIVSSHVAKGKVLKFDLSKAENLTGVVKIFTFENHPRAA